MSLLDFAYLFWLNPAKANAAGYCPVSLRLTLAGQRTEVSTAVRCLPQQWDTTTHRLLRGRGQHPSAKVFNQALDTLEGKVVLLRAQLPATTTLPELRAALCPAPAPRPVTPAAPLPEAPEAPEVPVLLNQAADRHANTYTRAYYQAAVAALTRYQDGRPLPTAACTAAWAAGLRDAWLAAAPAHRQYVLSLRALWNQTPALASYPNPFAGLLSASQRKRRRQRPRYVLTAAELSALAKLELTGREALGRDVYLAQYYLLGSRLGVVLELRWQQVDLAAQCVRLRAEKGGEWRTLPLPAALGRLLLAYRPACPAAAAFVFPLLPAGYFELEPAARFRARKAAATRVWMGLRTCGQLLALPGRLHPHTARHTLATHTVERTGNPRLVQHFLGHATLSMTEQYLRGLTSSEFDAGAAAVYGS